jgi:hypothetical protein
LVKKVLADNDERVARWVADRLPRLELGSTPYTAIGLVGPTGHLVAGVVYDTYIGTSIDMHVAAVPGKRWMTRKFLGEAFRYPFLQLGVRRVTGRVAADNAAAIEFDTRLGFQLEGRVRQLLDDGQDLLIFGMLREECRWLKTGLKRQHSHG